MTPRDSPRSAARSDPGPQPLRVLLVSPECEPLAKAGGLADVVPALGKALVRLGCDARVVMPCYRQLVDRRRHGVVADGSACVHLAGAGGGVEHWIGVASARLGALPVWLIEYDDYFARAGIYGEPAGEYRDNGYRFALLSRAALQLAVDRGFIPDVMHLHDWPAAPAALFLKTSERAGSPLSGTASLLTIHNIGHQGKVGADALGYLGVGPEHFHPDTLEDYGKLNLLKAGIRFADGITTVSPTHLAEILTPEGGHGLAPYLERRRDDLAGILNGVDEEIWDPARDPLLPARFDARDLAGKASCKAALQRRLGLDLRRDLPLFGIVSRLALQKGIELLREALPAVLDDQRAPMQLAVVGAGAREHEDFFRWLAFRFPGRAGALIGWSEELAHLVEAGSDFFLMPSLYEPCGLNQLYSMRYGTLPVVRATGGLEDSVEGYDERTGTGTGFKFHEPSGRALADTLRWVVSLWLTRQPEIEAMRRRAMVQDFSWERSARGYLEAYRRAVARRRAWG